MRNWRRLGTCNKPGRLPARSLNLQFEQDVRNFLRQGRRLCRVAILISFFCVPLSGCDKSYSPQHVILITIDTLRVDHLGCYGYPRPVSPFIDSLAREGLLFMNVYSTMATTGPAHASIFSGTYPLQHGIRRNGVGVLPDAMREGAGRR